MNRTMCAAYFPSSFEEEGCAGGAGWWSPRQTTPPAAQAPLLNKGGETELGKHQ